MKKAVIYIHGMGGNAAECEHYKPFFPDCDVFGFDYESETPFDAEKEFTSYFKRIRKIYDRITVIANSIGAYYTMTSRACKMIAEAYFISPVVDMEKIISDMMTRAKVTSDELREKRTVRTPSGDLLSWDYLCYVRNNPISWTVTTHILCGENDSLTSPGIMAHFAKRCGAELTVMKGGEHWFHTPEQMMFLDKWLQSCIALSIILPRNAAERS